ncbi:hypothetical protein JCM10914A_47780 [Paenibacillus sp. JCM 10914]|uniref:extracellular solute-binding protein n=1 Tax=Paenibacillus sp. JCM 10914 TaxID=1236974 RepID=UPI0003CC506F|nr:extracellular solute-binding protein [Paenibacillus sp. JCM 10914]GAE06544.1 predicted beta-xyloside ABC transporter, substrate-binding component [Paenibacillus sp. JCM 10914]
MNHTVKKLISISFVVVLTMITAACGNSNAPQNALPETDSPSNANTKKEAVTLTFQNTWPDSTDPRHVILREIVKQYEADHPNVKIELDTLNVDQQKLKLKTQAASKEMPDITIINPGAQLKPYVDADLFLPLNEMVLENDLQATFQDGVLEHFSFDDQLYALPTGNNIAVVAYNKRLFSEAGVTVPQTFAELIEAVELLKARGVQPMVIGEKDTWTGSFLFMNILLRTNGGSGFLNDVMDGSKTFHDSAFTEAVDAMSELIQAGAFQDGAASFDYNTAENLFKTGQSAMYFMGTWSTGAIETSEIGEKNEVGIFKFPTVGDKGDTNEFMLAPTAALAIAKNSKHVEEAKLFVNYYMLNYPKIAFDLKAAVGIAQKLDGDYEAAGYSEFSMDVLNMFNDVKGGDLAFDNTMNPGTTQVHLSSIQHLFIANKQASDIAAEHQKALEDNLED